MIELLKTANEDVILGLGGMLVGLVAIVGGIGVALTKVVSNHFRRSRLDDMEATLKLEMIQRGMSAADIKQVLEAKMGAKGSLGDLMAGLPPIRMPLGFGKQCGKAQPRPEPHA